MVIAVDFDGVLCEDRFPDIGGANLGAILHCKALQAEGHQLILWTCRRDGPLEAALEWLSYWGLEFDAVNSNLPENIEKYGGDTRKVSADIYVDDRNGDLPPTGGRVHLKEEKQC